METLEDRYKDYPNLLSFYEKKLLVLGWAGQVDDVEAVYIANELRRSPSLRRLWRVAEFTRRRKAITPAMAKRLVKWWAGMPMVSVKHQNSGTVKTGKSPGKVKSIDGIQTNFLATLEKGNEK